MFHLLIRFFLFLFDFVPNKPTLALDEGNFSAEVATAAYDK
jgi:hypothetical protein